MFIIPITKINQKKKHKVTVGVNVGVIEVPVINMQNSLNCHMRNPNMTAILRILVLGLFCTRSSTVASLFGFLTIHSRSCACMQKDPLSDTLILACKEDMVRSLSPEITLDVQPLCGSSIAIRDLVCQMHISELRVRVTFYPITTLMTSEMKLHSQCGRKNRACVYTVI
ncbi:hypothetical protein TNCV_176161 [Trichonephila clavipes]|nr:hypothetical protein TNCV_176161 [Trichonephila clavipes]